MLAKHKYTLLTAPIQCTILQFHERQHIEDKSCVLITRRTENWMLCLWWKEHRTMTAACAWLFLCQNVKTAARPHAGLHIGLLEGWTHYIGSLTSRPGRGVVRAASALQFVSKTKNFGRRLKVHCRNQRAAFCGRCRLVVTWLAWRELGGPTLIVDSCSLECSCCLPPITAPLTGFNYWPGRAQSSTT